MRQVILVAELKGFTKMATELAQDVEEIGVTPDRVRCASRTFIDTAITAAVSGSNINPLVAKRIGGDTWYFTFANARDGAHFGSFILAAVLDLVMTGGLYYLKPSLAMNCGIPRLSGDSFLDDESIAAYRTVDKGDPFRFLILPIAEAELIAASPEFTSFISKGSGEAWILNWQKYAHTQFDRDSPAAGLHISSLLTDNDAVHFATDAEVIRQVIREQDSATLVRIFGGVIPCEDPDYFEYARAAVGLVRSNRAECVVQNYFTCEPSVSNYVWLHACKRLVREHSRYFGYSAFKLSGDTVRPIAYHIYDDVAMLFLRRYNELRDNVSMAGSILIRNTQLAQRLREHFIEGIKVSGRLNKHDFDKFALSFSFPQHVITVGDRLVEDLFRA